MTPAERLVYDLKIQREALVRLAQDYHRARYYIQSNVKPGAAQDKAVAKLNADFPSGYCRTELMAINAGIAKAVTELQRCWLDNRKPGEHFSTRRINSGVVNR
jgi:hypothetical protein